MPRLEVLTILLVTTLEIPQRIAGSYQASKEKCDGSFYFPPVYKIYTSFPSKPTQFNFYKS